MYSNDVTIKFNGALFDALQSGNLMMAERIWNLICKKNLQVSKIILLNILND